MSEESAEFDEYFMREARRHRELLKEKYGDDE